MVAQFSELAAEVGQGGGEVGQVQAGQDTRGYSPVETGFAYLPMVVISLVGSVGSNARSWSDGSVYGNASSARPAPR